MRPFCCLPTSGNVEQEELALASNEQQSALFLIMLKFFRFYVALPLVTVAALLGQEPVGSPAQQQRITGTITAADPSAHVITVKEDKTGTAYTVELANTKSLRKVDPVTLDLKNATRITADDLMVGDRVQVFAVKAEDNPNAFAARGIILISARELQSVHQEQAAAWQHATRGVVTQVEADGKLVISQRTPEGPKTITVDAKNATLTRYSAENPKVPAASQLADIQVGDQVRVIGDASADGSTIVGQKVYSSPLRMLVCTVSAVSPDGKQLTVKNLQDKQAVTVTFNDDSAVRKLPPMMAMALARRLNPAAGTAGGSSGGAGSENSGSAGHAPAAVNQSDSSGGNSGGWRDGRGGSAAQAGGAPGGGEPGAGGGSGGGMRPGAGMRSGDLSQMLERVPKISATDLKPGDAVMVAGIPISNDKSHLLATTVVAGVEPIFQSASPRQMQSLGDWGLGAGAGGADGMPQ